MNSRFSFVGEIDANSVESKVPFYREITGKAEGLGLNLTVIAAKNNRAFTEVAGFKNDVIKTYDTENNELNISWDDRLKKENVEEVANYKKNIITLNGERHEFVATYDFIKFVIENIEKIKGKQFTVTGQIKKNVYKGKITDRFIIQNLFEVKEDEEKKNQLRIISEFFFEAASVDSADWKKEKKLRIDGFTKEYIDADHKAVYVSRQLVFNCEKVDFNNEMHIKRMKYKLAQLKLGFEDGKIVNNLKKGRYYSIIVVCNYYNGAEEIEFDDSELTANQKLAIELGLKTIDDFRPSGSIYGNRVVEYRLVDFDLKGDYADGAVVLDGTASDFEENIYNPPVEESLADLDDALNKPVDKVEVDDDDIFS